MRLFVGNIPHSANEDALSNHFEQNGYVIDRTKTKIIYDRSTNKSKGFGFVEILHLTVPDSVITSMNGSVMGGRKLTVNEAIDKRATTA